MKGNDVTKIIAELETRLANKRKKYEQVTKLVELLPMFKDRIISNEITGDRFEELASHYKGVYFAWGINLGINEPTNYEGEYKDQLHVSVYCNCISMFGEDLYNYANRTMHEAMQNVPMFHNDILNSTFYFEPHQVENGLDTIVAWYNEVKAKGDAILKQKRKEELERQLKELEN
jgi:hypothetical protein